MKVNGRIAEIKDSVAVETEEAKPMYKSHDHEEVPVQLLTNADNQFQVIF